MTCLQKRKRMSSIVSKNEISNYQFSALNLIVSIATNADLWDSFLSRQQYRPFLQSWTMGEVYRDIGQEPIRLEVSNNGTIIAICYAHVVPARRGKHLSIPYGPIIDSSLSDGQKSEVMMNLLEELKKLAQYFQCSFIRISPFQSTINYQLSIIHSVPSPLHLLAEHVWYLPLTSPDPWINDGKQTTNTTRTEEEILKEMRKTTRNLIRRAEKDGVTIEASMNPLNDLEDHFIRLHDETRKRHKFTPYSNAFFRAQVKHFAPRNECTVYLAKYQGEIIGASVHMHTFGETSYHHGASSSAHNKIPASYLLQWRAIQDAMKRKDHVYSFWGIAPRSDERCAMSDEQKNADTHSSKCITQSSKHPFAGVTLFKTGFGGNLLDLQHCIDVPVSKKYWLTYGFEVFRKWRRGF